MCNHPDCPTKANPRSKHLKWIGDDFVTSNPDFNPDLDKMPDGWHAKPHRLWAAKPQKKRIEVAVTEEELEATRDRLMKLWSELPEPRPDPMDFAAYETRWEQWFELYRISKTAPLYGDRIKANSVLLDFAKSRPKQSFEIASNQRDVDLDDLLIRILKAKGLGDDEIERIAGVKPLVQ